MSNISQYPILLLLQVTVTTPLMVAMVVMVILTMLLWYLHWVLDRNLRAMCHWYGFTRLLGNLVANFFRDIFAVFNFPLDWNFNRYFYWYIMTVFFLVLNNSF